MDMPKTTNSKTETTDKIIAAFIRAALVTVITYVYASAYIEPFGLGIALVSVLALGLLICEFVLGNEKVKAISNMVGLAGLIFTIGGLVEPSLFNYPESNERFASFMAAVFLLPGGGSSHANAHNSEQSNVHGDFNTHVYDYRNVYNKINK